MSADHGSEITGGKIFGLGLGAGGAIFAFLGLAAMGIGIFGPVAERFPQVVTIGIMLAAAGALMVMAAQKKKAANHKEERKEDKKEGEAKAH